MIDAEKLPTLGTERIRLRWVEESDVDDLFAIFSSPEVSRYWSSPAMTHTDQARELIRSIHKLFREHTLYQWGIARLKDDRLIGTCTLAHLDPQNRRAELGFALNHEHWKKGYMQEAVLEVIRFAFQDLGMHRLEADIDPRNVPSIALIERLGFAREGLLRERWIVAGEICDTVLYGRLASDPAPD